VSVPGAATANPPITQVAPAPVTPQQQIPTKDDLTPKPAPVQIVAIGPSAGQQQQQQLTQPQLPVSVVPPAPAALVAQPEHAQAEGQQKLPLENPIVPQTPQVTQVPTPAPQGDLTQVAKQIGEEIVGLTGSTPTTPTQSSNSNSSGAATLAGGKAYKAQTGDTLSKLAGRFMGGNTKANRDAIIAANASLQKNPDVIVAGKTYIIPVGNNSATPAVATQPPAQPTMTQTPSASPEYWYTVKEADTLRRIAVNQLGDEDAWAAIQELNKNTLKGEDKTVVIPGMKLKLPAKPIASAN
jgi:LysM repeat protein